MDALATVFRRGFCGPSAVLESRKLYLFPILMRQFGKDISLFAVFFIAALIALGMGAQLHPRLENSLFAKPTSYGHTHLRITDFLESTKTKSTQIVHLGSSTCYRGIDTAPFADLDHPSFNLCSSSQTFFNSKHLLEWCFEKGTQPKVVTLDIYPSVWHFSATESTRDLIVNHDHVNETVFQRMAWSSGDPFNAILAGYFGLKRAFVPLKNLPGQADEYRPGGFTFSMRGPVGPLKCDTIQPLLSPLQSRALQSIRKKCAEEEIQLILVNPPQLCEEVFEKPKVMEGVPWIEGNEWPLAKVDTLYYDDHHLRGVGAELYSAWLAGQVVALME